MPPLRARTEDIPTLINFFLNKFQQNYKLQLPSLNKKTLKTMLDYSWPGNVRELSNRIERLVLLGDEKELRRELEAQNGYQQNGSHISDTGGWRLPEQAINWDAFEKNCLQQALQRFDNNKTLAAKHLGMSYKTFVYRLNKFDIA
jgi:DNA-binding NtrC family response regulator